MKRGSSQLLTPVGPPQSRPLPRSGEQTVITFGEAVSMLKGYALERQKAISVNKSVINFGDKEQSINKILDSLKEVLLMTDYLKAAFIIIRLERSFMFVAPHKNLALYNAYADKIEIVMRQFREFIVYLKSKNQPN